jgi:hypothetical protein
VHRLPRRERRIVGDEIIAEAGFFFCGGGHCVIVPKD